MRCKAAQQMISAAQDGELGVDRRAAFQAHLDGCAACRAFAARVAVAAGLVVEWEAPEPSWGAADRVMNAVTAGTGSRGAAREWLDLLRPAPLGLSAAAFALGVALTVFANGAPASDDGSPEAGNGEQVAEYSEAVSNDSIETSLLALLTEQEE